MNNITKETKLTLFYILIAFAFSVAMRMIWVYQFSGYAPYIYNGQFMINTNDGYYWAEGARDILSGASNINSGSPIASAPAKLTAFFSFILPFSFESIIFYMPAFLGSLIVIPIILIAKDIKNLEMGFIAALFASVTWSYYNRTMIGYYDTDMLNIVLPMFLLWSIIWAVNTDEDKYLIITAINILIYKWWYPQSYSLEISFFGLIFLYTLIFDRKNLYNYKLMAIVMFAMMNFDGWIRLVAVFGAFYLFKQERFNKYIYYIFGISIILFFVTGGFNPILDRLKLFIFTDSVVSNNSGLNLHFFSVTQTIREAGHISFETFANRISGHKITFFLSLVGYVYLAYRHKIMLFALPMVGLGFLASVGGLRFTVYAVPIMAMGIAFLITEATRFITDKKIIKYLSYSAFVVLVLYPNYKHIDGYRVPTVFNTEEVNVLSTLKSKAKRDDYVVTWWDYGFPIRYYTEVKTLADGAKHRGNINFPISFILTKHQDEAAKMARLIVEYNEKIKSTTSMEAMIKDYGFDDANDFLLSLQTDIKLPKKTRDVYLYLPFKMLQIYPTVVKFSNLDLMDGVKKADPFYFMSRNFQESQDKINFGRGVLLNKKNQTLIINNKKIPLKRIVQTYYDKQMHLHANIKVVNNNAHLNLIYMSAYHTFLIVDDTVYNSLYIQLMVLENYDKSLFKQMILSPYAKVYKLKI